MRAPEQTFARARRLRREMTLPEVLLWGAIRRKAFGLRFRRQHPIGNYVLDFYLPSAKLAIEIDGLAHDGAAAADRDARRDQWLLGQGIRTLRFTAADVLDEDGFENVVRAIIATVGPPQAPLRSAISPVNGGGSGS